MPTYDYVCEDGHEFTAEQSITDEPLTKCTEEDCAADGVYECEATCKRVISKGTGFTLKGKGWGKDGYS